MEKPITTSFSSQSTEPKKNVTKEETYDDDDDDDVMLSFAEIKLSKNVG